VLRNCNYFLRFQFRLLTSYGSGSGSGSVFRQFSKKRWKNLAILHSKLFYREKIAKFHQIYWKMWMKKMLSEGNQIHNFTLRLWELLWFHIIRFRFRYGKSYSSGSATLLWFPLTWAAPSGSLVTDHSQRQCICFTCIVRGSGVLVKTTKF
jgi:hypothetical protein